MSSTAERLVAELHHRQGEMYAGGPVEPVLELLATDIVWHVPGNSPIAGHHRGIAEVTNYFEKRRQLTDSTMTMRPGSLTREGDAVMQFVEGSAVLGGEPVTWQTAGIYRVDDEHGWIREVWLVPLDLDVFDQIWGS